MMAAVRRRFGRLTLRQKLGSAFAALAIMAALCGGAGWIFFKRIADAASLSSEVTSPLLIESMALISNAERLRASVRNSITSGESVKEPLPLLSELDAEGRDHIRKLITLAERAGFGSQFEAVAELQGRLVGSLRALVDLRARKTIADTATAEAYGRIVAGATAANRAALAAARQFEQAITKEEEMAKVEAQSGSATVNDLSDRFFRAIIETFPGAQNAYRLLEAIARLRELSESAQATNSVLDLDHVETEVGRLFRNISSIRQKLATRMRTPEQMRLLANVDASIAEMASVLQGERSLIARKRESLSSETRFIANSKQLSEIEALYAQVLTGVASAVRDRDEASKLQTEDTIARGRIAIAVVLVLTALIALASGHFLRRGVTAPLERLTAHVRTIRDGGDLAAIADASLVQSRDELGELSRSFNDMIAELAQARRDLIATSEAEISKQVERLQAALTNMSQGLCMFDSEQRLIVSNSKYAEAYGIAPERIHTGMTLHEILRERVAAGSYYGDANSYLEQRTAANVGTRSSDTTVELGNGRSIHIVRRPMSDGGWVATHEDVTERRQIEAKISHMARHDEFTGLPNRLLFRESIDAAVAQVATGMRIAVHCIDLDYFKGVNDTLGHSLGDALLRAVSQRLLACVREHDTISRLGGDEFAIIQVVTDPQMEASRLAERVIAAISAPYDLDAHQVAIGATIGIAVAPEDGSEPDELMKNADLALYRAKADGRGRYCFFEAEMDKRMQARRKLEMDLRKALTGGEFQLYFQPIVNLRSNEVTGFEALLRWRHPQRGIVSPGEFIPVLEETSLIVSVGEWVLAEACRQATTWPANINVAVNLSAIQFKSPDLVRSVERALAGAGLPAGRLELEITESILLLDNAGTLATLHKLKELGTRIAMDDFGTGYSSLSYLRSFPFDKIKIDRSFVHDLPHREDSVAIVRAVTSLGGSLHMTTTAEGVETQEQLRELQVEGCTEVQGYLFSKPMPASDVASFLATDISTKGIAA